MYFIVILIGSFSSLQHYAGARFISNTLDSLLNNQVLLGNSFPLDAIYPVGMCNAVEPSSVYADPRSVARVLSGLSTASVHTRDDHVSRASCHKSL